MRKLFISLLCYSQLSWAAQPIMYIDLPALLGNRLWGFCVAKIIATELNYKLHCKPIWGFPNTYSYTPNFPQNNYGWERHNCFHDINLQEIIRNKAKRNISINGYFQRYHHIKSYAHIIRTDWLKIDPSLLHSVDPDDIVVHIRFYHDRPVLKFDYYKKALSMAQYKQVYICTDEPSHPYLEQFKPYNPIINSTKSLNAYLYTMPWDDIARMNIGDFAFIASFNKIIVADSTYSWWAAFLSNATEIYAPYTSSERGNTPYGKVDESRYTYIDTDIVI